MSNFFIPLFDLRLGRIQGSFEHLKQLSEGEFSLDDLQGAVQGRIYLSEMDKPVWQGDVLSVLMALWSSSISVLATHTMATIRCDDLEIALQLENLPRSGGRTIMVPKGSTRPVSTRVELSVTHNELVNKNHVLMGEDLTKWIHENITRLTDDLTEYLGSTTLPACLEAYLSPILAISHDGPITYTFNRGDYGSWAPIENE